MGNTIFENIYEFKNKLSRSKFKIFVDGSDSGYILDNDISEQRILSDSKDLDNAISVEEFVDKYANEVVISYNLQMFSAIETFNNLYSDCVGLAYAVCVEELREIHIISNSLDQLSKTDDARLQQIYNYISHNMYKGMCLRYNHYMRNSNSTCGSLKKKFNNLLFFPTCFGGLHLETDGYLKPLGLDKYLGKFGNVEIIYKAPNGRLMGADVKDAERVSLIFHRNQIIQQMIPSERDVVKREFLNNDTLQMDLGHLLLFPDYADLEGYVVSLRGSYEFIADCELNIDVLISNLTEGATCTKRTYLDFIYLRNNVNYMEQSRFKQLVKEMIV